MALHVAQSHAMGTAMTRHENYQIICIALNFDNHQALQNLMIPHELYHES